MKKKKVFALIISLALVFSVVLSGTLVAYADVTEGEPAVKEDAVIPTSAAEEDPVVPETPVAPEDPVAPEAPIAPEAPAEPEANPEANPEADELFRKLMACRTLEEAEALIAATPEEALRALTEEQVAQVETHMDSLMPAPLPAIVIEESEPPVESEICRPTVNYTYVAPFGEPVTGGN